MFDGNFHIVHTFCICLQVNYSYSFSSRVLSVGLEIENDKSCSQGLESWRIVIVSVTRIGVSYLFGLTFFFNIWNL